MNLLQSKKPTSKEVALMAGVSVATVSRVINGEPNVRPGTRQKVTAAIEALEYRPNNAARILAQRRSH